MSTEIDAVLAGPQPSAPFRASSCHIVIIFSEAAGPTTAEGSNKLQNIREQPIPCTQGGYLGPIKVIKEISASPPFAQSCRTHPSFRCLLFAATEQDQARTSLFQVQNDVVLVLLLVWARVGGGLFDTSLFPIRPSILSELPPLF